MTTPQVTAIIEECHDQAGHCLYTSTALYKWLKEAKFWNQVWNALPIILGALATFGILADAFPTFAAILALLAGLMPSVYEKLDLKTHTDEILSQAGQYKNLEYAFRQAALITALDSDQTSLMVEFNSLMRRIEELRSRPLVIPTKHFEKGQEEVQSGRYTPDAPGTGSNQRR